MHLSWGQYSGSRFTPALIGALILLGSTVSPLLNITLIDEASADSNFAGVAYASSLLSSRVKYREWIPSNASWSSEVALQDVGSQIVDTKFLFSPNSSLRAILSASGNGELNLFSCTASCTVAGSWTWAGGSSFADVGTMSLLGPTPKRPFDMSFEQSSGNLVIVYDKGAKLNNSFFHRVYSGGSLSAESSYLYSGDLIPRPINYFKMASAPSSDGLTMIFSDPLAFTSYAVIWDPSTDTWQDQIIVSSTMPPTSLNGESVGVAYETNSSASVVFSANGLDSAAYARWTGSWSAISATDPEPSVPLNAVIFASMKGDPGPGSNRIMICQAGLSLTCAQINAGVLGSWNDPGSQPVTLASRAFDFAWEPDGSTGVIVTESGLTNDYTSRVWTGASWIAGETISSNIGHLWIQGTTNPFINDSVNSIFVGSNILSELDYITYDGTTMTLTSGGLSVTHLGSAFYEGASVHFNQELSSIPQNYSRSATENVLVSDGVARQLAAQGSPSDSFGIFDAISRELSKERLLADLFSIISGLVTTLESAGSSAESLPVVDSVNAVKTPGSGSGGVGGGSGGGGGRRSVNSDAVAPIASASPPGDVYASSQLVELWASEPATIYYSTDGSTPTTSSAVYSSAIHVTANVTLMFFAIDAAGNVGSVVVETYTFNRIGDVVPIPDTTPLLPASGTQAIDDPAQNGRAGEGHSAIVDDDDMPAKLENGSSKVSAVDIAADDNGWGIAVVGGAMLAAASVPPLALFRRGGRNILIHGILIDSDSIIRDIAQPGEDGFARLIELQLELCWITGLEPKHVKIVLTSHMASSFGLVRGQPGPAAETEDESSLIVAKGDQLSLECLRDQMEEHAVQRGQRWFVLSNDNFDYDRERLSLMLFGLPEGEYRDYRINALAKKAVDINFILEASGKPRLQIERGNMTYQRKPVQGLRFRTKQGKSRIKPKSRWLDDQLMIMGVRITAEGERLMTYEEKRDLLISAAADKYSSELQARSSREIQGYSRFDGPPILGNKDPIE